MHNRYVHMAALSLGTQCMSVRFGSDLARYIVLKSAKGFVFVRFCQFCFWRWTLICDSPLSAQLVDMYNQIITHFRSFIGIRLLSNSHSHSWLPAPTPISSFPIYLSHSHFLLPPMLPLPLLPPSSLPHLLLQRHTCRTHSVILVGAGGEVSYTESTLTDFDSFSWDSKTIKFTLEDDRLDGNKL